MVPHVPLDRMPTINTPFQRVAIDLIRAFSLITDNRNCYVLTMMDYTTSYPENIAIPFIETDCVVEDSIEMFSGVGVPSEILSDGQFQFMSQFMQVNRLLSIKHIPSSM